MPRNRKSDYEVGYAKPPKNWQFKKGRSGNPRGRPKGGNLFVEMNRLLDDEVTVPINGRSVTLTYVQLIARQVVSRLGKGDPRLLQFVMKMSYEQEQAERERAARHLTHEEMLDLLDKEIPRELNRGAEIGESDDEE